MMFPPSKITPPHGRATLLRSQFGGSLTLPVGDFHAAWCPSGAWVIPPKIVLVLVVVLVLEPQKRPTTRTIFIRRGEPSGSWVIPPKIGLSGKGFPRLIFIQRAADESA
jgi:hypothetical protein